MKKFRIVLSISLVLFLIISGFMFKASAQSDVKGIWSGTVAMKQTYTGELGHSVLQINTSFNANRGTGTMTFEGQWKAPFRNRTSCSGSGSAELHILNMSEEDNIYSGYYIHVIGPDYTCSPADDEVPQNAKDITISDKVLTSNNNILSGTQTFTAETGTGPATTILTWHLVRSTNDIDDPCTACGSVIGIENQSLGQAIAITGTPFNLHYRSDRLRGNDGALDIGAWTFNVHHSLWGQRLELGDGRQRTFGDELGAIKAVENEIPGVVPAAGYLISSRNGSEAYVFDGSGRHLRTLDALTNALIYEFKYNASLQLTAIVDAYGLATTIERSSNGLPAAIVSPYGQRTDLVLDNNQNLTSIINPAGEKNSFSYSSSGLLTTMIDTRGFSHTYEYDPSGRLIKDLDPAGGFTSLSFTSTTNGHTVAVSTALMRTGSYSIANQVGGVNKRVVMFPDGSKNTITTWPDGHRTVEFGDGIVVKLLDKPDKRWGNQVLLPALTVKLPSGLTSTLTTTRSVTQTNPLNPLNLSGLTETYSINGRVFNMNYSASDKTFKLTSPSGLSFLAVLDNNGRIIRAQANGMAEVRVTYDKNGRPLIIEQGLVSNFRRYQLTYNSEGYLKSIVDPLDQTNSFIYDAAGRITQSTLPDGRILSAQYDATGNLTSFTPAGKPAHGFEYDKTNHITKYFPPNVSSGQNATRYEYNADHQVTTVIRPDGQTINLAYDPGGCSCGKLASLSTPTGKIIFSYHPTTGKLSSITSPGNIKLAQTYDAPLLTSETWSGPIAGSVTRRYNSDHQVATYSVNGTQAITNIYDSDGILTKAGELVITRTPKNIQTSTTTLNDVKESWKYNEFGEIIRSEAKYKGISLLDIDYTYDVLGRIITMRETIGSVINEYRNGYDKAGRLVSVSKNAANSNYSYDSNDNLLNSSTPNGVINGKYDDQDRIISFGNTTFTFTDNGELLTQTSPSGTTTYKYDVFGNLMQVTLPDSKLIEYLVDGRNRRIGKKVNGTLVKGFVYLDGLRIAAELDGNGKVVTRFIYGTRYNLPDYMIRNGVKYRIIADHLNSPRLVVDVQTGKIIQQLDYDEFGNILVDTKPGFQPFGFAGGLYDNDTKLTRFGFRDYDATIGRWTTKDPIRFRGMSSNFYQYAAGDPINRNDPWGLQNSSEDYSDVVCSLDAGIERGKKQLKEIDTFRGTNGQRYGMETEGGSEIDMRHYAAAYNTVQKLGGKGSYYAFGMSQILGLGMELSQCKGDWKSAFNSSDLLSNLMGALDAFHGNTPTAGTSGPNGYLKF